jgi:outer membrane lipoprotein carrier protein
MRDMRGGRAGKRASGRPSHIVALAVGFLFLAGFTGQAAPQPAFPLSRFPAQDPDPKALIQRSAQAYQRITSFSAAFRQILADSMIGTFESQGNLTQAGESKLAMRFTDPAGEAIVMDGEHIWVYTPSTTPGQVIRLKIPSDPTYGPNLLAWFLTNPAERYSVRYVKTDAIGGRAVDVVSLTPVDKSLPFNSAVLYLDQYDYLPRRLEVREKGGNRRTLILSAVETNRRVSPATFSFAIPSGVRVVDQ